MRHERAFIRYGCLGVILSMCFCSAGVAAQARPAARAYRYSAELRDRMGDYSSSLESDGVLYLEPDDEGVPHVVFEEDADELRFLPIDDHDAVRAYFPEPSQLMSSPRLERRWDMPICGAIDEPEALPLAEALERVSSSRDAIEVRFTRRGRIEALDYDPAFSLTQRGDGTFDRAARAYSRVHTTFEVVEQDRSEDRRVLQEDVELVYDLRLSRARQQLLAAIGSEEAAGRLDLEAYAAEHDRADELRVIAATVVEGSTREDFTVLEWFHARASTEAMWQALAAEPNPEAREHRLELLYFMPLLSGESLDDAAIAVLRGSYAGDPELTRIVIELADPRLAPEVARIAAQARASGDRDLAARAADALRTIEAEAHLAPNVGRVRAAFRDPERFLELAAWHIETANDPRAVLPLLVQALVHPTFDSEARTRVVHLLRVLTLTPAGDDAARWRAYWRDHAMLPYGEWMVEATRDERPGTRAAAAVRLGDFDAMPAAADRLAELTRDPAICVRFAAAETLAAWRDRRAAPVLVRALSDRERSTRVRAFMALAFLHDRTLGYDPEAAPLDRARAVGRWKRWAESAADAWLASR